MVPLRTAAAARPAPCGPTRGATARRPSLAAARSGLRRARAGRADGRRRAPRQGRRRHRLPPLPDQGGAARGARATRLRATLAALRPRGARRPTIHGRRSSTCCGAAPSCTPATARSRRRSPSAQTAIADERARASSRTCSASLAELMRRCQEAGRHAPGRRCSTTCRSLMCGIGSASAMAHPRPEAWRRHLDARDRRPARRAPPVAARR